MSTAHPPAYIYAEQLLKCQHGLPLWEPEPTKLGEVLIGDVGFIQNGCFYRLFNVLRPADDPANSRGVPEGFIRLEIDESIIHTLDNYLSPAPVFHQKSVECRVVAGVNAYALHMT